MVTASLTNYKQQHVKIVLIAQVYPSQTSFITTHIMQFIEKHKQRPQISTELPKSKSSGNLLGSLETEVTALSHSDLPDSVSFRLQIFDFEKLKIS